MAAVRAIPFLNLPLTHQMKALRLARAVLFAGATAFLASCGDAVSSTRSPIDPRPARDLLGLGPALGLVACTPMPADSATQLIGPEGGTLNVGAHALVVPPGALDTAVVITAVAPSDSVNRVQFGPAGLTFRRPASLTMSYANCGVLGVLLPRQIVYTTDLLQLLEVLGGVDDLLSQKVTARIHHFSDYVVAW
jgi:hypothetical protein